MFHKSNIVPNIGFGMLKPTVPKEETEAVCVAATTPNIKKLNQTILLNKLELAPKL